MAIPIATTGSYNFNEIQLTESYARVSSIESSNGTSAGTDFTGSYTVDVFFNSESFSSYMTDVDTSVEPIDSFYFSHVFEFDEGKTDPWNQSYNNLIASQSEFINMTKKIFS